MKYNKNIVLNILSSEFFKQIEEFIEQCVWELDGSELAHIIYEGADYAELDYIDGLRILDYDVWQEEENEHISGALEVSAVIDGYAYWEGEDIAVGFGFYTLGLTFEFLGYGDHYSDLELDLEYTC